MTLLKTIRKLFNKKRKNVAEFGYVHDPIWWDYAIWYPYEGEEGYDGVHDGGLKGIRDDAPQKVKEAFYDFFEEYQINPCIL